MTDKSPEMIDQLPPVETPRAHYWSNGVRFFSVLLVVGLIALLGWGLVQASKEPLEDGMAPDFTLTSFDGRTYTLSELRGQVVIINFWASWCPPCREEAAYLESTWRKYQDKGVIFIGVDYADAEKPALAYIDEFDITYFNGPDLGTRISQKYNIKGVPETYYVAKDGSLKGNQIGPLFPPKLDNRIDELLAEPYSE
ncbi:MAG TPA: TlpA disulfide reductase family protein [Bellilinea sp.]|nr:TlpA disulfide reductase family protein [Bellilinea sp.]